MADYAIRGKIVWVRLGPRGDFKKRPAVVLSDVRDPPDDAVIRVMGGSTKFDFPLDDDEVELPYLSRPGGHPYTKLKVPTVVVCNWIEDVRVSDVLQYGGVVPNKVLFQMMKKMK